MTSSEVNTEEGWHSCDDGEKLYFKIWKTKEQPRARMVLLHGFSDHCNTYGALFPTLASRGIEVFGFDGRGWGRSVKHPSQRGRTGPTSQVMADITSVLSRFIPSPSTPSTTKSPSQSQSPPLFLYGHSMGGQCALYYASNLNVSSPSTSSTLSSSPPTLLPHIRGILLEAPYISLDPATKPYPLTVILGRLAQRIAPHKQLHQQVRAQFLTRDAAVNDALAADPLCHDMGTLEGLAGMLDRAGALEAGLARVERGSVRSMRVAHGSGDRVCACAATRKWFETSCGVEDREFREYEGWYHRLCVEAGGHKDTYAQDTADWILARC